MFSHVAKAPNLLLGLFGLIYDPCESFETNFSSYVYKKRSA